ncbi:MAG: sigma factor-like helix-turn-helix DNA-binding protein [Candidatus Margulisiibacteriota bacterium]
MRAHFKIIACENDVGIDWETGLLKSYFSLPVLSANQVNDYFEKLRTSENQAIKACEALAKDNQEWLMKIVKEYGHRGVPEEKLLKAGKSALIEAFSEHNFKNAEKRLIIQKIRQAIAFCIGKANNSKFKLSRNELYIDRILDEVKQHTPNAKTSVVELAEFIRKREPKKFSKYFSANFIPDVLGMSEKEEFVPDKYKQEEEKNCTELHFSDEKIANLEGLKKDSLEIRNILLIHNVRWVKSNALKYRDQGVDLPDLVQAGLRGLDRAISSYNHTLGTTLLSYATVAICQCITDAIVIENGSISIAGKALKCRALFIEQAGNYVKEHRKEPTLERLTKYINLKCENQYNYSMVYVAELLALDSHLPKQVINLTAIKQNHPAEKIQSLSIPVFEDKCLGDCIPAQPEGAESLDEADSRKFFKAAVRAGLMALEKSPGRVDMSRLIFLIENLYGLKDGNPLTLDEVGEKLNITKERVRQLKGDAIEKLRPILGHMDVFKKRFDKYKELLATGSFI